MSLRSLILRIAAVATAVIVCSAGAWIAVRDDTRLYEHRTTFVLRPNPALDPSTYGNAQSTIEREDIGIELTLTSLLASRPFLREVLTHTGVQRDAELYSTRVILRPGTNIVDFRLRGPDETTLAMTEAALLVATRRLATDTFRGVYIFDHVATSAASEPVEPQIRRRVQLVAVLALIVAGSAAYLGMRIRTRLARRSRGLVSAEQDPAV